MPSLYAKYLKERNDDEIVETEKGFASYRYINDGKSVYLTDIYVLPEFRKENVASMIADEIALIAKSKGATEMIGTVVPTANNSTSSLKVLLGYGMTLQSASNNCIVFKKDLV